MFKQGSLKYLSSALNIIIAVIFVMMPISGYATDLDSISTITSTSQPQLEQEKSPFHDQFEVPGCTEPVAIKLPLKFLPVYKSRALLDYQRKQIKSIKFSAVYTSQFLVHQQWAVPSTISAGMLNNTQLEQMQGVLTIDDFRTINQRTSEQLVQRSEKIKKYLSVVEKSRSTEDYKLAQYLFNNTFYVTPNHFLYFDVSTVQVGKVYNVQKINAVNFFYIGGCVAYVSLEVIDNLVNFDEFRKLNSEILVDEPDALAPRFKEVDDRTEEERTKDNE
jgi:hypothetical protein